MKNDNEKLILHVIASFFGSIGYGDIYKCQVISIQTGLLDEDEIRVTILAGDKKNSDFISAHLDAVGFEMGCIKKGTNAPYEMMPISGFVDNNRNIWEIEYVGAGKQGHNFS